MATSTAPELLPFTVDCPPIWCPIPVRMHPDAEGIDDHLLDWAKRSDLIRSRSAAERFHSAGFGEFAARVYPRATRLHLVAEWQAFNWIVDDRLDEGYLEGSHQEREHIVHDLVAQMPLDLRAPRASGPLTAALSDLWQRTANHHSWAWRERFAAHYLDFLAFTLLPHSRPEGPAVPPSDVPTFVRRRRLNSGCEMSFDLIETANAQEVPAAVARSDAYRAVRLAANDVISWTNDMFSIRKETARGDQDHLAAVLRHSTGSTWQEALTRAAVMVEALTRDFLEASEDLRASRAVYGLGHAAWIPVDESLTDLGEWIAGSLSWHQWSPRYKDVETTEAGAVPTYIERHLV
ncbi:hypothetical protein QMK19_27745 [Streptomyces sp. H10-C2]|uniref:terpene synthase family protein n=1 Tax=unclassified Streptomyces TaxID=2593676 RepID=UPI0024BA0492|nr:MULTISPECIES: hypothetical protein [unclassified Streptomyces]MDJ0343905.1 hypothetical protein [Streptomyces sp. PH10-H1]MDJ0373346.1 hypothetical protein [Streptomyces sp. H10-C2]